MVIPQDQPRTGVACGIIIGGLCCWHERQIITGNQRLLDLDRLSLRIPLDLKLLKRNWFAALEEARKLTVALLPEEIGGFYLGPDRNPVTPDPSSAGFPNLIRHHGSLCGAWPTVAPDPSR